jgi:hypothetical protein
MTSVARVLLVVALLEFLMMGGLHRPAIAAEAQFSLAVGQSVTVGQYTLVFTGKVSALPAYDLYRGSVLVARFPLSGSVVNPAEYSYGNGNIGIATTALAPDGTRVSGRMVVR